MLNDYLILAFTSYIQISNSNQTESIYWGFILYAIFFLVFSVLLILAWWKSDWISTFIVRGSEDSNITVSTSNLDLLNVIMRVLGLYLLIRALPNLIGLAVDAIAHDRSIFINYPIPWDSWVYYAVTLIISLWLVFGSRSVARILKTIWTLGMKEPEEKE